ncbi:5-formyltetrahydrofolate cyclo-ligase [Tessaracoccus antarcticus]|nr:5-formyltetrahydrofolate cyclo-ligase [Tessaracoccus antarcticus]
MLPTAPKDALRRGILLQRTRVADSTWASEDAARTAWLLGALGKGPATVALYASRPGEPGTRTAITTLHDAGWLVLLPRLGRRPDWAIFGGWEQMGPGWGGIPEPTTPPLGAAALARADVVVAACLAVAQDGTRVGTGGGWYDRALPHRRPGTPVWVLARTQELFRRAPHAPHDIPVDGALTQDGFFACGEGALSHIGKPWPPELS